MKYSTIVLGAALCAPTLALAQDISGAITNGFGRHSISGIDQEITTNTLDGRVSLAFENGMTLGVEGGYIELGQSNTDGRITAPFVGIDVGYTMSNGLSFGIYVEELTGQVSGFPLDVSLQSFGAEIGYQTGNLELGLQSGRTSLSPELVENVDTLGLTAKYAVSPALDIGATWLRASLELGPMTADVDLTGLAASYDVTDDLLIFGGISRSTLGDADLEVSTMGLGAGYRLTKLVGVASTLSLEVARTRISMSGSGQDLDTVRLGMTFPLGGKDTEVPLNSVADSVFNPRAGAINSTLTSAF